MKENILVSECLLGINCKYDGNNNYKEYIEALKEKYNIIPFCGEVLGGLTTPRIPSERLGDRVVNKAGEDVTSNFMRGAKESLKLAKMFNCKKSVVKCKSPSCGYGEIYDGSFSKTLIAGNGCTIDLFLKNGIEIYTEKDIEKNKDILDTNNER